MKREGVTFAEERLHSSLGYLTPDEFAGRWSAESPEGQKSLETKEPIVVCSPKSVPPASLVLALVTRTQKLVQK
jgi:hypothetical protein